ncbi:MAG: type II secretion system protein [Planctomycetes bacterium]|nr:type II secretion system protein [Planctomycetota bacterium]
MFRFAAVRRASGFTLLEVMLCVAVFAIALTPMIQICQNSLREAGAARNLLVAAFLAREKMGEYESFDAREERASGDFPDEAGFQWTKETSLEHQSLDPPQGGQGELQFDVEKTVVTVTDVPADPQQPPSVKVVVVSYRLRKEDEQPKEDKAAQPGGGAGAPESGQTPKK